MSRFLPFRFEPIFRSYIWGGRGLASRLGKSIPPDGVWAESWEIVDHGPDQSIVSEGEFAGWTLRRLVESFSKEILGSGVSSNTGFPLLLKYLDCNRVLSVQVHPNDEYAKKMPKPDLGKTEAWYIVDSAPGAVLYAGLKPGIGRKELEQAIEQQEAETCLQTLFPKAGDCVFIPAGTIHALGAGLIVAEIQQASDTTFRLFDWNRLGDDGKPRPLHVPQALEVIDFDAPSVTFAVRKPCADNAGSMLVDCDKFQLFEWKQSVDLFMQNTCTIVTVTEGEASLERKGGLQQLRSGESALIPASMTSCKLQIEKASTVLTARPVMASCL